jgi:hypothetical protein
MYSQYSKMFFERDITLPGRSEVSLVAATPCQVQLCAVLVGVSQQVTWAQMQCGWVHVLSCVTGFEAIFPTLPQRKITKMCQLESVHMFVCSPRALTETGVTDFYNNLFLVLWKKPTNAQGCRKQFIVLIKSPTCFGIQMPSSGGYLFLFKLLQF